MSKRKDANRTPKITVSRKAKSLLSMLLNLRQRVAGNAELSRADRQLIAVLLGKIADDDDPRQLFWETIKHRPRRRDDGRPWLAAFVYWSRVALKMDRPGKVLAGKVAKLSGLTDAQVEQARRACHDARAFVASCRPKMLRELLELRQTELKDQRRRK